MGDARAEMRHVLAALEEQEQVSKNIHPLSSARQSQADYCGGDGVFLGERASEDMGVLRDCSRHSFLSPVLPDILRLLK